MKTILALALLVFLNSLHAKPLDIEPLPEAASKFEQTYVKQCEELIAEIQHAFPNEDPKIVSKKLEIARRYLRNSRADCIPGLRRAIEANDRKEIEVWCGRLSTNVSGFRRATDHLVIISVADGRLTLGDALLGKLKAHWELEDYFSWRFTYESQRGDSN